ncbi:MAG: biopolymer transporter ExbD [Lentisphaeria bacterium]|jgi:biopolymer transport protein ExbD|nr:biopolymer transporter ExbD [Lentisphaeria bacterium]
MARWKTDVEVVPGNYPLVALIDLFFILLIFFLIENSVVFWPGTKVETSLSLPRTPNPQLHEADKLIITITRSGQIFFNEKSLDWHGLEKELGNRVRESGIAAAGRLNQPPGQADPTRRPPMVVLRADRNLSYDVITSVVSLARSLGLGVYMVTDTNSGDGSQTRNLAD